MSVPRLCSPRRSRSHASDEEDEEASEDEDDDDDDDERARARWRHDGEAECDHEAFVDHDERCHGPMDCKANRRAVPENFIWSCCGGDLSSRGCVRRAPGEARCAGDNGSVSSDTRSGVARDGHTGDLEPDEDGWEDHDERCHGRINTAANRRDFPDGFVWSCCGKRGDGSPCVSDDEEDEDVSS
jgi:hypothetical protein